MELTFKHATFPRSRYLMPDDCQQSMEKVVVNKSGEITFRRDINIENGESKLLCGIAGFIKFRNFDSQNLIRLHVELRVAPWP